MQVTRTRSDGPASSDRRAKWRAIAVTALVVIAIVGPVLRSPPTDSFPLSTFPMFSTLIDPVVDVDYVVGLDRTGNDVTLNPETIAGTDEVIIAGSVVTQAVRAGGAAVESLCLAAAARLAGPDTRIVALEVRTDRVDAIAWFDGDSTPLLTTVHGRCDVG